MLSKQYYVEKAKVEKLIARKNQKTDFYHGIYDRYEYPVLTREFAPVEWRYDLNPKTNPNFQERLGINAVMNSGAIELNGKYYLVVRVEGNDRKSFFAVAESDTGIGFGLCDDIEHAVIDEEKIISKRIYHTLTESKNGAGTNRMNIYTVRKATQGLANFIIKENAQAKGVAIAFDSRHMSPEFAKETALCMAANGIKAYIFPSLRQTPMLSFALRELGCTAGVVVTASHNPPQYNGYKVYWEDGAQITAPKDKRSSQKFRQSQISLR